MARESRTPCRQIGPRQLAETAQTASVIPVSKRDHRRRPSKAPRRRPAARDAARRRERREPDLIDEVAEALATGEPLDLLELTSAFLAAVDPRGRSPFETPAEPSLPPLEQIVQTFVEMPLPETSALLAAIAGLTRDDVLRSRARREIAARGHALPRWLAELDRARSHERVIEMAHVLRDGENVMFGVALAGGSELSIAVYVDHNLGTLVKDAFVAPGGLPELFEFLQDTTDDPDVTFTEIDAADARARITQAIELGATVFPPLETETWPACRPLVEWAVSLLPAGGRGYARPDWSDADRDALAARFLASPFGAGLADPDHRDLLDQLLWFGTDVGPGDPLRWSPVAVEMLLADWIPRKIVADVSYLAKAPEVLRALIRFSHAERGLRAELTDETLAAVDELEPEYQAVIRSPRLQGPDALLAAMGLLDPDELLDEMELVELHRAVGGPRALDELDTGPLPDEPFAWTRVPEDVHDRVAEVLGLVDQCCDALLDVEHRTAARRLLAAVAEGDPGIFRRRSRAETAAAAICWLVAKANRRFDRGDLAVKDLMGCFGPETGSPSQRSTVMRQAIGVDPFEPGEVALGSPDYLTAARRRQLVAARDRLSAPGQ
jgi:hypothetical protein